MNILGGLLPTFNIPKRENQIIPISNWDPKAFSVYYAIASAPWFRWVMQTSIDHLESKQLQYHIKLTISWVWTRHLW